MPKKLLHNSSLLIAIVLVFLGWKVLGDKWTLDSGKAPPPSETWIVMKISDGDTITVRQTDGQEMKVRLCGIDAPEVRHGKVPGQPLGEESKKKLESLVAAAEKQVMIIPIERDRYGRTVAEVMASVSGPWGQEMSFQEEMLKSGMAYYYKKYASKCPNYQAFENAQEIAKDNKAGVWSNPNLEKPWDYRKRYR